MSRLNNRVLLVFCLMFLLRVHAAAVEPAATQPPEIAGIVPARITDPQLQEIIRRVLEYNSSLARMAAAVDLLTARYSASRASKFPTAAAQFSAGILGGSSESQAYLSASLPVSYELDVWGRLRAGRGASMYELKAGEEDRLALSVTLVAQTIETYYRGLYLQWYLRSLDALISTVEKTASLRQRQFEEGLISAEETRRSSQDVKELCVLRDGMRGEITGVEHDLKALQGEYPTHGWLQGEFALPHALEDIPVGMPSSLLQRRPDIRALKARLDAADLRAGAAKAAFFPQITLTAVGQKSSLDLQELVNGKSAFWNVFGVVSIPIMDGGLKKAQLREEEARQSALLEEYRGVLLQAFKEVEDALSLGSARFEALEHARQRVEELKKIYEMHRDRYEQGIEDLVPVEEARRDFLAAELERGTEQLKLIVNRIQLMRAVAGGW